MHRERRQRSAEDFRRRAGLVYLPSSSGGLTLRITGNILKWKGCQVEMGQGEVETCSFKAENIEIRSLY